MLQNRPRHRLLRSCVGAAARDGIEILKPELLTKKKPSRRRLDFHFYKCVDNHLWKNLRSFRKGNRGQS